ncbi:hypothetical protein H8S90_13880 [Olivibacter sp. SDN3]|uniref:hypothetical protein n=1 Tax=Olivibacter sp. SDN3 TaxID=2764720 RepID=UPI0016510558|nr:hypothetical protein [Olivibacter sp. SDN3]QNL47908.1 hypothetical protein H8S90_13880 [Olivibacter sp. SDN3]
MNKFTTHIFAALLFLLAALLFSQSNNARPIKFNLDIEAPATGLNNTDQGFAAFTRSFITTRDNEEPHPDEFLQGDYEQLLAEYE